MRAKNENKVYLVNVLFVSNLRVNLLLNKRMY